MSASTAAPKSMGAVIRTVPEGISCSSGSSVTASCSEATSAPLRANNEAPAVLSETLRVVR